jgi:ubiquinone/menaquinone biosynthesis C-methylase UbiE
MTRAGFFEGSGMPDAGWWEALWPDPAKVLIEAGVAPGMSVVDLCAGDGWFAWAMCGIARSVLAIDIDTEMLQRAKVRFTERGGADNCTFVVADAYDIARMVPRPVDHVFMANTFHGVPDKPRLVRAVHDALMPGGLFAIVNWHAIAREETPVLGEPRGPATALRMTPEQTVASVEPSRLRFRRQVEVSPYHYAAVFERVR